MLVVWLRVNLNPSVANMFLLLFYLAVVSEGRSPKTARENLREVTAVLAF